MKRKRFFSIFLMLCMLMLMPAATLPVRAEAAPNPGLAQADETEEKASVRIAFIDSGISTKHIDSSKVLQGANYIFRDADTQDRVGHGTATAGLVLGAEDQRVTGICPDALAVPLVVVDKYPSGAEKNGGPEALCEALYDAVDRFGCRIVNISLCTTEDSKELREAVAYAEAKGVVLIAAVGNDGEDGQTYYPAAYETVIAVGSTDGDTVAHFSQSGADILTEGKNLLTATNRNSATPTLVSGTSYSCALITGICARMISEDPERTPAAVRSTLFLRAKDLLEPGFDSRSGWGVISAYQNDWYTQSGAPDTPQVKADSRQDLGYRVLQFCWNRLTAFLKNFKASLCTRR